MGLDIGSLSGKATVDEIKKALPDESQQLRRAKMAQTGCRLVLSALLASSFQDAPAFNTLNPWSPEYQTPDFRFLLNFTNVAVLTAYAIDTALTPMVIRLEANQFFRDNMIKYASELDKSKESLINLARMRFPVPAG